LLSVTLITKTLLKVSDCRLISKHLVSLWRGCLDLDSWMERWTSPL